MEKKSAREIQQALALPFAPEDLEWRLQTTLEEKMRGLAVPFVTNRAIQNRLDDVVGPSNWYNDYKPWHGVGKKESQLCGIAIYFEERGFITKWDGTEDSDVEPVKGGLSDSMKRAAVQWDIGRILYGINTVWVDIEKRGKSYVIKDNKRHKLDQAYSKMLQKLGLSPAPAGGIQSLLTPKESDEEQKTQATMPLSAKKNDIGLTDVGQSAPAAIPNQQPKAAAQQAKSAASKQPGPAALPSEPAPESQGTYEYMVLAAKVQGGMSGSSTLVSMKDRNGKQLQAFARGARLELQRGTALANVKLSVRQQDTVAFYALESYEFVLPQKHAA